MRRDECGTLTGAEREGLESCPSRAINKPMRGKWNMKNMLLTFIVAVFILSTAAVDSSAEIRFLRDNPTESTEFFCGYCHILSYPKVIKKAHASWKEGKHKDVPCIQCHYPPEELEKTIPGHKRIPGDKAAAKRLRSDMEYMQTELEVLSRLVTILNMDKSTVQRRPRVDDRNCTTKKCHGSPKDNYMDKKIPLAKKKVIFTHKAHFDKKKWVKGDVMHCTTCHKQTTDKKHFETSRQDCNLCHFASVKNMNEKLSKCEICHKVPTKPLQKQKKEGEPVDPDKKPITHKTLEEAKVPCASCHLHLVKGNGATEPEKCLECHDNVKSVMSKADNQELMHEKHVADQTARCLSCHTPIEHKKPKNATAFLDDSRTNCQACHPDHHIYQKALLIGKGFGDIPNTPALMSGVTTNCLGCHVKKGHKKGEDVKVASHDACVSCHTKRHEAMLKEWKEKIKTELDDLAEVEKEAIAAIEAAKKKGNSSKVQKAEALLKEGQDVVNIVRYGNGVHNKKYAVTIIDAGFGYFEGILDELGE